MKSKKLISLILTCAMLFTTVSVFAENTASETDGKYTKDVKIMRALGFMDKFSAEDENTVVKRGEFAAVVTDLAGLNGSASSQKTPFHDVTTATKYYNEICVAAQNGIVRGNSNLDFHPENNITFLEAATMLINALGYSEYAQYKGGYPDGYTQLAAELDIYDGVDTKEKVTIGAAARMMLNAGDAQMLEIKAVGGEIAYEPSEKMFAKLHDIYSDEGILSANEYTSIDSRNGVGQNNVKIGDVTAKIYYSNEVTDYLGYNVEYYYRDEDGEKTVLYMIPEDTEVEIIAGTDITDYIQGNIYYDKNGKIEHETIPASATIIYNGRLTNSYYIDVDGVEKSIFDFDNGEVKLISNDDDREIEVVSILAYDNIVVAAVNKQAEKIFDLYDDKKFIDYSVAEDAGNSWIITDAVGNLITFEDVKEKSVLSVAKSIDGEILRAVMSTNTVVGSIASSMDRGEDKLVTIGDKEYIVHASYLRKNNLPNFSNTVTALLDFAGGIAGFEAGAASGGYGYIIKTYLDDLGENYGAWLLTTDGSVGNYMFADSVKIDGQRYRDDELNGYLSTFAGECVVLYKINDKKEITMIDTPTDTGDDGDDVLRPLQEASYSTSYFNSVKNFNGTMLMSANTLVFSTPLDEELKGDRTLYTVSSIPAVEGGVSLRVQGFVSDDDKFVAECIHLSSGGGATNLNQGSPYMLVEKVSTAVNSDDESVLQFTGYNGSGTLTTVTVSSTFRKGNNSYTIDASDVVPGDIIKYVLDGRGEVSAISPIKKMGTEGLGSFNNQFMSWFSRADFAVFFGYLMSREGGNLALVNTKAQLQGELQPDMVLSTTANTKVYYISTGGNGKIVIEQMASGDYSVLADYMHSYQETPLIITTAGGGIRNIYVYEQKEED